MADRDPRARSAAGHRSASIVGRGLVAGSAESGLRFAFMVKIRRVAGVHIFNYIILQSNNNLLIFIYCIRLGLERRGKNGS